MKKQLITITAAVIALVAIHNVNANPYTYGNYYAPQTTVVANPYGYGAYAGAYANGCGYGTYTSAYANGYGAYANSYVQNYGGCYAPQYGCGYGRYYNDRPEIKIRVKNKTTYNNITRNNFYHRRHGYDYGWGNRCWNRYPDRAYRQRTRESHEYREKHTYETDTRRPPRFRRNYRYGW